MIVSTKGRYALRVMVNFAGRPQGEYIPLKAISEEEGISRGLHHRQHSETDGGQPCGSFLYLSGCLLLPEDRVLPDQAHVGQAGQDDR